MAGMKDIIEEQRRFFLSGQTLDYSYRVKQLETLRDALKSHEPQLMEAIRKDLGKSAFEGYETEYLLLFEEIAHTLRHLKSWMKPRRVSTPLMHFPSSSKIYTEPLGVVLILSPWNYPIQLTVAPLIAALAAGNCAVIKPSRYSPNTALAIEEMLKCFPAGYVSVFQGGSDVNKALLEIKFDHIFFTGSPAVGRVVMEAAAKHLTPVTLELGGKSPCIVDETANLSVAARRIVWGKCINAGQTCVAPDYLLVHSAVKDAFAEELKKSIRRFYGDDPLTNPDYPKIINRKHFDRLCGLMAGERALYGGKTDAESLKIEPTILDNVTPRSTVMGEEIFGPLLPILSYERPEEIFETVRAFPKPLAFYYFTSDKSREEKLLKHLSFGGGCVNDTVVHLATSSMHFGGVGESGMGAYHGKTGFETFSHQKGVLKKSSRVDIPFRYPPYGEKLKHLKKLAK